MSEVFPTIDLPPELKAWLDAPAVTQHVVNNTLVDRDAFLAFWRLAERAWSYGLIARYDYMANDEKIVLTIPEIDTLPARVYAYEEAFTE